jgi:pyruvate-ferredoxin/flavodoxin oxidoreductase
MLPDTGQRVTVDGNEAVASIAYLTNEVIAIYPITPASGMGEHADEWAAANQPNLWGAVPQVIEMQSEGGAAGAVHGALQGGALSTTFTASQGLLLMIPNMYKIAGELTPTVFHIAARAIAAHALSIFGDHQDVMATRATGFAMLSSASVQEAMDMTLIAQAAALEGQLPMLHFFDGFRTSHEVATVMRPDATVVQAMMPEAAIARHRQRTMSPEHPVLRGSSQNPDVYFQSRERSNPYFQAMPAVVQAQMDRFAQLTGRTYRLFQYEGAQDAERIIVLMGSGAETAHETVEHLLAHGEKVGVLKVRLYRPFSATDCLAALPASVQKIAVLDRTKEPGADGEPLYKDILTALTQDFMFGNSRFARLPLVIGGRYGLASKEFTPGMVKAVFDELACANPKREFTVGIHDDVSGLSLEWDENFRTDAEAATLKAVFFGLGADGTVSANKNSIRIIGEETGLYAQGYFVYDSKKSGAVTVSHLRFAEQPIHSPYLVGDGDAQFVACHQPVFLERYDMLDKAKPGGVFLLNSPIAADQVWDSLPRKVQQQMIDKQLSFYTIDAVEVATSAGMGGRINTIMQTCFFAISGILPRDEAITQIKQAVEKTYGRKGRRLVEMNFRAIDMALENLHQVSVPGSVSSEWERPPVVPDHAPELVRTLTAPLIAGLGDRVPVSLLPADGTFPLGTAQWEKRNIALQIPVWDEKLCTQCGKCVFVCPHSAIRAKVFPADVADAAPETFKHVPVRSKGYEAGLHISYQVAPEDCTGCALCVEACPIRDKSAVSHKALNMAEQPPLRLQERANWAFFAGIADYERSKLKSSAIPSAMLLQPLFEFSGACSGCGETPYIRLATQLFGDRMLVANATGCSSIYGGNLPTTPYTQNAQGHGPAWNNSLFEDNAEFGLGLRVASDALTDYARNLLKRLAGSIGEEQVTALLEAGQSDEAGIQLQRERVAQLRTRLQALNSADARALEEVTDYLVRRSVWIIGGDGWAYDIGYGGLDHVLAQHRNVNILVLDTEVYSNTGGQTSKATPMGAVAKFSAAGKPTYKKDLAKLAMDYGHVYVAQVAFGAKDVHTLRTFLEAESYDGPSLIIAYSPCIAHGVDMTNNLRQQDLAVKSGHWPLLHYDPRRAAAGENPLKVDYAAPSIPMQDFFSTEARFAMLFRSHPEAAAQFLETAGHNARERFRHYSELAALPGEAEASQQEAAHD